MLFLHMAQTQPSTKWSQDHLTIWDNKSRNKINITVIGELSTENPVKIIPDYCAFLVLEGDGFYEDSHGFTQILEPGSYVQHIPGLFHVITRASHTPWMELSFRLSPEPARWLITNDFVETNIPVKFLSDWQYRADQFLHFMKLVKDSSKPYSYRKAFAWFLNWIDELDEEKPPLIEQMKRCLESDLSALIEERELLNNLSYSYGYLRGYFKEQTGETPRFYREKIRANEAAALIKSSGLTVAAAAEMFGYSDPFVFSRAFKRVTGEPPSQYKVSPLAQKTKGEIE